MSSFLNSPVPSYSIETTGTAVRSSILFAMASVTSEGRQSDELVCQQFISYSRQYSGLSIAAAHKTLPLPALSIDPTTSAFTIQAPACFSGIG